MQGATVLIAAFFTPHLETYGAALLRLEEAWQMAYHDRSRSGTPIRDTYYALRTEMQTRFGEGFIREWEEL